MTATLSPSTRVISRLTNGKLPNTDPQTGVRYGVISQHSVMPEALDHIVCNGRDLDFEAYLEQSAAELCDTIRAAESEDDIPEHCRDEVTEAHTLDRWRGIPAWHALRDCRRIVSESYHWSDRYLSDGVTYLYSEPNGLMLTYDTDSGNVTVLSSPVVLRCRECSPCYPCAGDLNAPDETGVETYALPLDWLTEDEPPYSSSDYVVTMARRRELRRAERLAGRYWGFSDVLDFFAPNQFYEGAQDDRLASESDLVTALEEGRAVECEIRATAQGDYGGQGSVGAANERALMNSAAAPLLSVKTYDHGGRAVRFALDGRIFANVHNARSESETEALAELGEMLHGLSKYPLIDDEAHSEVEIEWQSEAWDDYIRDEFLEALEKAHFPDDEDEDEDGRRQRAINRERFDDLCNAGPSRWRAATTDEERAATTDEERAVDGALRELFQSLAEFTNTYWETDYNSANIDVDRIVAGIGAAPTRWGSTSPITDASDFLDQWREKRDEHAQWIARQRGRE